LRWAGDVDLERALSLGSDVPFCVVGGRALVEGIGERVTPLSLERRDVTLCLAPFGVSTADCYRRFDERAADGLTNAGRNELTRAAFDVEPRLATAVSFLEAQTGLGGGRGGVRVDVLLRRAPRGRSGRDRSKHLRESVNIIPTATSGAEA
jgi:hypothetical protein